ncbi:MAG TPA: hypothetical protein VJL07_01790 [Dehalococcoidia bacterium]|nr:hypothetical protein [Dehalococcoidia bacterium]
MLLSRYLSIEIFFVHIGHGALFWVVIAILAIELPWWASLILLPVALFSIAGWAGEARFVLPVAIRLWQGESVTPMKPSRREKNTHEESDV